MINNLKLEMIKKNISIKNMCQKMKDKGVNIRPYVLGQRLSNIENFKYKELKVILKILDLKFEEIEETEF